MTSPIFDLRKLKSLTTVFSADPYSDKLKNYKIAILTHHVINLNVYLNCPDTLYVSITLSKIFDSPLKSVDNCTYMPFEHMEDWLRLKWIQQHNVRTSFFFSIWLTNTCCVVCTNTQYCKTDEDDGANADHFLPSSVLN
ncbi:hypothetical protein BpHYR1_028278 [Brachionus plicatilis]|uniref:Uncharacterized protein n=1 Tax=Brachionus plicatilis TaxID=10195 RepID=A0A3M7QN31_BRAPC|nr:hypothetical protein BpHYR1_028278 [Brachionus plicatilis]